MPPTPVAGALPSPLARLADALLLSADTASPIDPATRLPDLTLADAERVQDAIVAARVARGERRLGMKIGFTNRTIWDLYGVHHPIWGPVYDTTLVLLSGTTTHIACHRFNEPRIEPEIVLCLRQTPANASPTAIAEAIEWVAHGFEIVQSAYPGWRFSGAESFAAQGLHGALHVGPRFSPAELLGTSMSADTLIARLSALELELFADARLVKRGTGAHVLDGPIQALGHLVAALAERGRALAPGDIITTGTLTDGHPIAPGQRWESRPSGLDLPGLQLDTE
ncbi:MAG: fumarylacetoacetate hydrolase family protein [Burkholderiaceae bacterium]|nr:fumarylacetoacetate hydrolase family protein [Burkholderiaceae bacterium]